jgi:hypothetical protein
VGDVARHAKVPAALEAYRYDWVAALSAMREREERDRWDLVHTASPIPACWRVTSSLNSITS